MASFAQANPEVKQQNLSPVTIKITLMAMQRQELVQKRTHLWSVSLKASWVMTPQWNVLMCVVRFPNCY